MESCPGDRYRWDVDGWALLVAQMHQPKPHMSPGRPELGRKDSPVILSAAKDLATPSLTPVLCCSQAFPVILSAAKDLPAHRARPFAALRVTIGATAKHLASLRVTVSRGER